MPALLYYAVTEKYYSRLSRLDMDVHIAPLMAERVLERLGLSDRLRYRLRPRGDWHHYDPNSRTVELAGPTCTVLEVLLEWSS